MYEYQKEKVLKRLQHFNECVLETKTPRPPSKLNIKFSTYAVCRACDRQSHEFSCLGSK